MIPFIFYLLKTGACLSLIYLFFYLFLKKESSFNTIRIYWFLLAVISLSIPFIIIRVPVKPEAITMTSLGYNLLSGSLEYSEQTAHKSMDPVTILFLIYLTGVVLLGIRFIARYIKALIILRDARPIDYGKYPCYISGSTDQPFTLFESIILPEDIQEEKELQNILWHERVHVAQKHWVDIVFFDLLIIFQWFNPLAWSLAKSVKLNHEYLADREVMKNSQDSTYYYRILLKYALGSDHALAVNYFSKSKLKNRIKMMTTKTTTTRLSFYRYLLIMPLVGILVSAFAEFKPDYKGSVFPVDENSNQYITDDEKITISGVVRDTETGNPVEGVTVIVKSIQTGTITDHEGYYRIKTDPDTEISFILNGWETVNIKVTKSGKKNVQFKRTREIIEVPPPPPAVNTNETPPQSQVEEATPPEVPEVESPSEVVEKISTIKFRDENGKEFEPMYFLNGERSSSEAISQLSPEHIETISVLKGDSAASIYGSEAKNGVILVETRK